MAKRVTVKPGDIFEVPLENNTKGYFQFIMLDLTQLNSEVIRVFKKRYAANETPDFSAVVKDEVQFYAHVVIKFGVKMNLWDKVENVPLESSIEAPYFRGSNDYGNPEIKVSKSWYIWKANEDFVQVGELKGEHINYDAGSVLAAPEIPEIMNTGKSSYFYPSYK
jgi:hypothetical protein